MPRDTDIPELLNTVSREWGDGRAHLAKAIKSYVGATTALKTAATSHPLWALRYPTSALKEELELLSLGLADLDKTRGMLANTWNTECAPINRLPSELLAFIFQIIVDDAYPHDIYDSMSYINPATKLAFVCSCWRQTALETGSLWSCVVFPYQADRNYEHVLTIARMQLERTQGSPIDLFVSHKPSFEANDTRFLSTCNMVNRHARQVRSLRVRLDRNKDIESLLECCLMNGTAGSLSKLEILANFSSHYLFHQANSQTLERLDEYLRSVRMLKLRSVAFDWRCAAFEQLEDLDLYNLHSKCCPNLTQLARVLSASPNLRRLRLKEIMIHGKMKPTIHSPVMLQHLNKLILDRLGDSSASKALSILSSGRQNLSLTFNAKSSSLPIPTVLRPFATENHIGTFRFIDAPHRQSLQEILESLPDLKYLILDELELVDSDFDALVHRNKLPAASHLTLPAQAKLTSTLPKLKHLALMKCTIVSDQVRFKEAISSLSLDSFYLGNCCVEVRTESQGRFGGVSSRLCSIGVMTELGIWLTENVTGKLVIE
ncbi:hypothetical protein BDV93DRAFT_608973 [Ceratobasidium sp. AG-I]|nr:hypothetical protein BDV93DRAFT_608973 [Ceratobasidium sp. AG-I]